MLRFCELMLRLRWPADVLHGKRRFVRRLFINNTTFHQPIGDFIMPLKKPLSLVNSHAVRRIPPSLAWLDHRIRSNGFLETFTPSEIALYFFLALAADQQGLSCRRLDVMQRTMPTFHFHQFHDARDLLIQKRLLAFKPWSQKDLDGVYQLLALPVKQQNQSNDLQTTLANVIKSVS